MLGTKGKKGQLAKEVAVAVATAVPLLVSGQPGAALAALSAASPSLISGLSTLFEGPPPTQAEATWRVLSKSFTVALALFFSKAPVQRRPAERELETLIESLVNRAGFIIEKSGTAITPDMLFAPLKIPFVRDAAKNLPHELRTYSLDKEVSDCRSLFENCFIEALDHVRNLDPNGFADFERGITSIFNEAIEKRKALSRHHESIIRAFTQRPVFGQEDTGITLSDLYVRQRAVWNTREKIDSSGNDDDHEISDLVDARDFFHDERNPHSWAYPLHLDDLHSTIWSWLDRGDQLDAMRVVAGGPGSGKSTFARAFAIEAIDKGTYDVLFVPLQEIEPTGTFQQRIEHLFRDRTDLGLDGVPNPLQWLGVREPNGAPPAKPLLLICDGLDEIAPPDSAEAITVTVDFIQSLKNWMDSKNSGGFFTCAIVLGRTISAQEAFKKAAIDTAALIRVGGLLPIENTEEWKAADSRGRVLDHSGLASVDQRTTFWENWCKASNLDATLPVALQGDTDAARALQELTTEPLLLYLLVWTGYLGERWEVAAENRNNVYEEIFRQIYVRRWGIGPVNNSARNREAGGHASIESLRQEEFFLLQEALGLAAWATGGRTVALEAYNTMLKTYLDPDTYEDLSADLASSLKSVALQSYTRSIGSESAGYEFVHKSIGEYLIARGVTTWILSSVSTLTDRISDSRSASAAVALSKIIWNGPLTSEIDQFLDDEIRLRIKTPEEAKDKLRLFIPIINWILGNGLPVNREVPPGYSMARTTLAEQRALDVFWTALQSVSRQAYPREYFENNERNRGWTSGPLVINWQGPFGFAGLYSKLSSPSLIAETKRLAKFDYLDLRGQALMETTFGAIQYTSNKDGTASPNEWLHMSMYGTNLSNIDFLGSNLWIADLSYADLTGASLHGSNLEGTKFERSKMNGAKLSESRCINSRFNDADLTDSDLSASSFNRCDFTGATLFQVRAGRPRHYDEIYGNPAVIVDCKFDQTNLRAASLTFAIIAECDFGTADLRGANLQTAVLVNTSLDGSQTDSNSKLPPKKNHLTYASSSAGARRSELSDRTTVLGALVRARGGRLTFVVRR